MTTNKVCLASWAPFHAGAEIALERLAVGLKETGANVWVILGVAGETLSRLNDSGIRCEHIPLALTDKWKWWRYQRAQRLLRERLKEERPNIVHCNDLPTAQMICQAAGELQIPRICHHRFVFGGAAIDWMNKFGAERHLFVSQYLSEYLSSRSPTLASSPRAVVFDGLPIPPKSALEFRADARQELQLSTDKVMILFAGQIIERKGVADLLRAWMLLPEQVREIAELTIVGDDLGNRGAYRKKMEVLARELNCPAHFVGFQKNVETWLAAADVAAVPSHVEPLGNATLEAMAVGLPVIGSRVGGIPEMVVHERTGLLVPPESPTDLAWALQRLIRDEDQRIRLGLEGRERCRQIFSVDRHVRNVMAQYQAVLKDDCTARERHHACP